MPHPIEKIWREVGLPEWFLGNGDTNTKLYELYDRIAKAPKRDTPERITSPHTDERINKCPGCGRMFVDGETCSRGGCPMGGDF